MNPTSRIIIGDCLQVLRTLPDASVQTCITSPPYWGLRDYGHEGQLGLERTPEEYVANMVAVFREVRRVLRDDGTLWLNLGDSYAQGGQRSTDRNDENEADIMRRSSLYATGKPKALTGGNSSASIESVHGLKPKDLCGIPWRVAFALQADGWWLRQDIIWHKPNPMPESVTDRCTKAHEYIFLMTKSARYYYDAEAVQEEAIHAGCVVKNDQGKNGQMGDYGQTRTGFLKEGGVTVAGTRNRRSVWTVASQPFSGAHFATFPPALIEPCVLAGSRGAGKRCDCDDIINSPTGHGKTDDPSMSTGRAGMNRIRKENEGTRPITKREQKWHARQISESPHRDEIAIKCGSAFAHYIRTDDSGARPLPEKLRVEFIEYGWITDPPPCDHPIEDADTVLDPFNGAGTTGLVALGRSRNYVGIEINPEYAEMARARIDAPAPLFRSTELLAA